MSVAALQNLLATRWHGATLDGRTQSLRGLKTGIAPLDSILGKPGIPCGRLTEIFGTQSSGRMTVAYALLARCTSQGDLAAIVDPLKVTYAPAAEAAGIDLPSLIIVQPKDAAAFRRAADAALRNGAFAAVVLDAHRDDLLQTHHCSRLVAQAEKTATTLVVLSAGTSQPLASFATLRIRVHGLRPLWQEGSDGARRLSGYEIAAHIAKSKVGVPGQTALFASHLKEVAGSWPLPERSASPLDTRAQVMS